MTESAPAWLLRGAATRLAEEVSPRVHARRVPLEVRAWTTPERVTPAGVPLTRLAPVSIGHRFGPVWSTTWFALRGRVPDEWRGLPLTLRFSCATEALLWLNGEPWHGLDVHHDEAPLFTARGGEEIDLLIEAACNLPLGATCFWWDEVELRKRWAEERPGRLEYADLCAPDEHARALLDTAQWAHDVARSLPEDSPRRAHLTSALRQALSPGAGETRDRAAAALLRRVLAERSASRVDPRRARGILAGHAHIDTAWLWRTIETRRKVMRSWATAVRLLERDKSFTFIATQPQLYEWLRQDAPALYARIAHFVEQGRWEPSGAAWVEPDANLPCGESLIRQLTYGIDWFERAFGAAGRQHCLFLPDTFGFCAALPQIIRGAGLEAFVFNKLSWNQVHPFPFASFRWRGLDGTEMLSHCTPGREYNTGLFPADLHRAQEAALAKHGSVRTPLFFQPYGWGDGGGGPTSAMVSRLHLSRSSAPLPACRPGTLRSFIAELKRERAALRRRGTDLPVHEGALYLEAHRGTYTSQAWLKQACRDAEHALFEAEWLNACAADPSARAGGQHALSEAWRVLLLQQFHDILPGSSIAAVYDDAREQLAAMRRRVDELIQGHTSAGPETSGAPASAAKPGEPEAFILNTADHARRAVVRTTHGLRLTQVVPPLASAALGAAAPADTARVSLRRVRGGFMLGNGIVTAGIDPRGMLRTLSFGGRASVVSGASFELFEDLPRSWEAWELDADYREHPVRSAVRVSDGPRGAIDESSLRATIACRADLGAGSRLAWTWRLDACSPILELDLEIDWRESRRVLRLEIASPLRSPRITAGVAFGHERRPLPRSDEDRRSSFEFPAHGFLDLREKGRGVSLLTDGIYGHSAGAGHLGLSLLRSPNFPDPECDRGAHRRVIGLCPHDGAVAPAELRHRSLSLARSMRLLAVDPFADGPLFTLAGSAAASVEIAAVKCADDGSGDRIVRLVERRGRGGTISMNWRDAGVVRLTDLRERRDRASEKEASFRHRGAQSELNLRAFRIVTLRWSAMPPRPAHASDSSAPRRLAPRARRTRPREA